MLQALWSTRWQASMRRRRDRRGRRAGEGGESGERQSRSRSSSRENASGLCLSGVQTQPRVRHTMSHTRRHGPPVARALVCTKQYLMLDDCTSHILPHLAHGRIWPFGLTVGPLAKQNRTHGERIRRCVLETTSSIAISTFATVSRSSSTSTLAALCSRP